MLLKLVLIHNWYNSIYDVTGFDDLKGLTLNYDNGDTETFELSVINDGEIELYHQTSETYYTFIGKGFLQFLKGGTSSKEEVKPVRNNNRKRTIVKRQTIERKDLK